jgi:hypothetical protein
VQRKRIVFIKTERIKVIGGKPVVNPKRSAIRDLS